MLRYFVLVGILTSNLVSQTDDAFLINPKIKLGIMVPGIGSWSLGRSDKIINPSYGFGFGIVTKPFHFIDKTIINFEIDVTYGKTKTVSTEFINQNVEFYLSSLPIVFWSKLSSPGVLSPYIKIGIGVVQTRYVQRFEKIEYGFEDLHYEISKWFFCWAVGGGIEIQFLNPVLLSIFIDTFLQEKDINIATPKIRNWNTFVGIAFVFNFENIY